MAPIRVSSARLPVAWARVTSCPWAAAGKVSTSLAMAASAASPSATGIPFGQPRARPVTVAAATSSVAAGSRSSSAASLAASPPRATCSATRSTKANWGRFGRPVAATSAGRTCAACTAAAAVAASASTGSASVRGSVTSSTTICPASASAGHSETASSTANRTSGEESRATPEPASLESAAWSRGSTLMAFMRTPADG